MYIDDIRYGSKPMPTNADALRALADAKGIPLRTLAQVQQAIQQAKRTKADKSLARIMLRHGRMTDEAREWLAREYP
jgi:hypothetical protein